MVASINEGGGLLAERPEKWSNREYTGRNKFQEGRNVISPIQSEPPWRSSHFRATLAQENQPAPPSLLHSLQLSCPPISQSLPSLTTPSTSRPPPMMVCSHPQSLYCSQTLSRQSLREARSGRTLHCRTTSNGSRYSTDRRCTKLHQRLSLSNLLCRKTNEAPGVHCGRPMHFSCRVVSS